jgi:arylsulfatase A-like enzyme
MTEPHLPFRRDDVDDEWYDRYHPDAVDPLPYLPDCRGVREDVAAFYGLLSGAVDPAVGRIDDTLHDAGIADETLVVFTTDHGAPFPRAKGTLYDPGIETALIARGPGVDPGTEDALLSNVDVLPTLLDYTGAAVPDVRGRSFAPLLTSKGTYDSRERIFAELTYHMNYNPMRAVRGRDWKRIRHFGHGPRVTIPGDIFDSRAGVTVRGEFYTERRPRGGVRPQRRSERTGVGCPQRDSVRARHHRRGRRDGPTPIAPVGPPRLDGADRRPAARRTGRAAVPPTTAVRLVRGPRRRALAEPF